MTDSITIFLASKAQMCSSDGLEPYLHDCVVRRDEDREQVKIPGSEDKCQQHLRLPRDA